ncbi:MAG: molybdenum cofactor biosynthesis protein MoaE [Actinobacteria bacterium]|nr:molybdenum cofactor biosynthesis protein MoaE [Actinomycetota bacterium]
MAERRRQFNRRSGQVAEPVATKRGREVERFTAEVLLFAWIAELADARSVAIQLPHGVRASTVIARALKHAGLDETLGASDSVRLAVNREYVGPGHIVKEFDELALIPPISGGAPVHVRICSEPLDLQMLHDMVVTDGSGAVVTFTGTTRDVDLLHYEAYEVMAVQRIERIVDDLLENYRLEAVAIEHRVGDVPRSHPSVIVAVSARHRPAAFTAAREAIDRIKAEVPIWKLEVDSGYRSWVRGVLPELRRSG